MTFDIFNDEEFKQQDYFVQQEVADNFFENELADEEFYKLSKEEQDSVRLNFKNEVTQSFDKNMYEPYGKKIGIENMFGSGDQSKFGNQLTGQVDTIYPDAQENSTYKLQQDIQLSDNKRSVSKGIQDFYSGRVSEADAKLNVDSEWYKKQAIEDRLEQALQYFNQNIADDEFKAIPDEEKTQVLNNYFNKVVKPTKEEAQYQHNFMNAILNFADKALYTVTGDQDFQNLSTAREYQQNLDETTLGQVGWLGGSVAPYLAGGVAAGTIKGLTPALLTDSAIQATLTTLEHARSDKALENIARDIAIDTGVNLVTFGVVRHLAKANASKGDLDKAAQQLFSKNVDELDEVEAVKFDKIKQKAQAKIIDESNNLNKTEVEQVKQEFDDILNNPDAMLDTVDAPKVDTDTFKQLSKDNMIESVVPVNKKSEAAKARVENQRLQAERMFGADEDKIKEYMRIKKKPTNNPSYQNMSESDIKYLDENTPLQPSPPVTPEEIAEAERIFMLGGDELGGSLGGLTLNEAAMYYDENMLGRELTPEEKWARRILAMAGGAYAGRKFGGGDGAKMFVGAKADDAGAFSNIYDKGVRKWIDDIGATMKPLDDNIVSHKLEDVIDHPELFKAYPDLRNMRVSKGTSSYYSPQLKHIKIGETKSADNMLISKYEKLEQNIYDKYDALAKGGELHPKLEAKAEKEIEDLYSVLRSKLTNKKEFDKSTLLHEIQHAIQSKEGWANGGNIVYSRDAGIDEIASARGDYYRLAGEQEARAVQAKLKHPELEPYQALAKEEGKLPEPIVKFDDGVAMSAKPDDLPKQSQGQLKNETTLQKVQRVMQDKFNRVKQLQKAKAGNEIADDINMYQMEANMHGRAADRMEKATKNIIEPLEEKIAKSNYSVDDLDQYLWARHAEERNARMLELNGVENGSGMSNAEAQKILDELDTPEMQQLAKYVDNLNEATLRLIEREGLETQEYIDMLRQSYNNYVPLHREMDKPLFGVGTGKGFDIKGKEFKRAKGSDLPVESPLVHSILQFQKTLVRAEKNKVGKSLLKFIEQYPDANLYSVKGVKYTPQYDVDGNIVRMNPSYQLADNVMHVKVDGKIKEITFKDDALARAFKNLGSSEMKALMIPLHKMVRWLASVSTQYNPEFILSNFTRDIQTALMNVPKEARPSRLQMTADVLPAIRGIKKSLGGTDNEWGKLFKEMKAEGGTTGWMEQYAFGDLKKKIQRDIDLQTTKNVAKKGYKKWIEFLDYIDDVNTAVENGVRLVVYKQAKKAGISNAKAANIAKELTVNFNKKGEWGTTMNTLYMFFNASIQGSARMLKALAKNKVAQGGAVGLAGVGAWLDTYNNSVSPDEWRRIPDYKKDTNLIVMKEDGTYISVPLPYGYNVFKTLGESGSEAFRGETRNVAGRALGALVSAFSPIGANSEDAIHTFTPTLAKLPYELGTNQNFFGGNIRPEVKYAGTDKADAQQYFKSVNPLARNTALWMNEVTGGNYYESGLIDTSPENLEHAAEFVTGGLGKFIMRTQQWATNKITGEENDWNKVPFTRRFYGEPYDKAAKMMAYEAVKKSETELFTAKERANFEKDISDSVKSGDLEEKDALGLRRSFERGQIKIRWAKKYNIQDKPTPLQEYELEKMMFNELYRNKKFKYGRGTLTSKARELAKMKKKL